MQDRNILNMMDLLQAQSVRHAWPEMNPDFSIERPNGCPFYVFIHLWNSVLMQLEGETIKTDPSACIVFDINHPQNWKPLEGGIIHDWIHIEGDLPALLASCGLEFNKIYYPKSGRFITMITEELEQEFFAGKLHGNELCDIKLRELFYKLARSCREDEPQIIPDEKTVSAMKTLRREIFSDLAHSPKGSEMARRLSVSESKFYLLYKEIFGITPAKDIINARIESAKIYLSSGQYSVEQTAFLVGYKSAFHFIRQFKQQTGITPGKFLQEQIK